MSQGTDTPLPGPEAFSLFKFYEEAAEKAKAHAWSQTTWLLALNSGLIAFSVKFYADDGDVPGFFGIECLTCAVGVALCVYLIVVLQELGTHISHYWTSANKIAVDYAPLLPFIRPEEQAAAKSRNSAPFPNFCRRLQVLAGLFLLAHVGWVVVLACLKA